MRGQLHVIKQLEAKGANVEARGHKNRTPLEIAELNKQTQVANYLKAMQDINKCRVSAGAASGGLIWLGGGANPKFQL